MNARDIFRLVIKCGGVYVLWCAVSSYIEAVMISLGYTKSQGATATYWIVWGVFDSVAGLYLLFDGKLLLEWAFPEEPSKKAGDQTSESDEQGES